MAKSLSLSKTSSSASSINKGGVSTLSVNTSAPLAYRDVAGSGGYTYRQYEDGTILILVSKGNTLSSPLKVATNDPSWIAIQKEIGPFPQQINPQTGKKWTAQEWALVLNTGVNAASSIIQAGAKKSRKKRGVPEALPPVMAAEASPMPPWAIPAAIGGGLLVLVLAMRGGGGGQAQRAA